MLSSAKCIRCPKFALKGLIFLLGSQFVFLSLHCFFSFSLSFGGFASGATSRVQRPEFPSGAPLAPGRGVVDPGSPRRHCPGVLPLDDAPVLLPLDGDGVGAPGPLRGVVAPAEGRGAEVPLGAPLRAPGGPPPGSCGSIQGRPDSTYLKKNKLLIKKKTLNSAQSVEF